jgi:hypothetical protein
VLLPTMTKTELQRFGEEEGNYYSRSFWWGAGVGLGLGIVLLVVLLLADPDLQFLRGRNADGFVVVETKYGSVDVGLPVVTAVLGGIVGVIVGRVFRKKRW